ncbi:uncharacterized protein F4807DRAFT_405607 [Annulohypoxylon truncatum]|uniref:uncharacterized protein n=1 Tax=Annulohypoxylon truncatum TaxID=327061 RepID=UPI002008AA2F|nr:uncharacterized protein F4807DRAFT_405607 [Annulohypoxylon truncatum]KAI1215035.1 hypothetical protein F4807DRAFT_405607 [Annulohypoxylon truncatum]
MGVHNATIRKKRRIRRRYAIAITMKPFLEHQQSGAISRFFPDSCESEGDDMYLFDTPLQQPPTLDPDHEFVKIRESTTTFALKTFLEFRLSGDSQNELNEVRNRFRMRWRSKDVAKDDPALIVGESPIPVKRHFPCPFYIDNPSKHLECLTRANLTEIKNVKQHLWNAHRLLPYCPTCNEIFTTTGNSDAHIRSRSCSPRGVPRPEGISLQQMQQLARRAETWMSEDLQWLSLWEIVFPGAELPDFTHPSRTVEFMVCQFQDYWASQGERVISDFLEEKGIQDHKLLYGERNLVALRAIVLDQVVDRLVESFEHDDDSTITTKTEQVLASLRHS